MDCNIKTLSLIINDIFPEYEDQITETTGPDDIPNWDSMNHLNLIMIIQEKMNIQFDFNEIISINSVGDIIETINKK